VNTEPVPTSASPPWDPGQVELSVQMDVGSAPLTLAALQALQPGYVFTLETPQDVPVTARVNGVAIGQGELVQVDGKLGVRLVKVDRHAG
jgi:type III secretion protein Q